MAAIAQSTSGPARFIRQARGVVSLMRPLNLLIMAAGVGVGGLLAGGEAMWTGAHAAPLLTAALSALLIGGGGNSLNDYFDLEIDRINRPGRPLPSGSVSRRIAWAVWALASLGGVALGATLSTRHLALALGAVALLYVYNVAWKRTVLLGNLAVALVTAASLVYGAWVVGGTGPVLVGTAFAFLTSLAREIAKDVQDYTGDAAAGARTTAGALGSRRAAQLASGVLALTIALTPLPYLFLGYGGSFLLAVTLADAFMLYALWRVQDGSEAGAGAASTAVKGAMLAGIAALAIASIG